MKKYIIKLLYICFAAILLNSCLEDYLDKAPEAGLDEEEVFTKYENILKYFNTVYTGYTSKNFQNLGGTYEFNITNAFPMRWAQKQTYTWDGLTPMCDQGYLAASSHYIKSGTFAENRIRAFSYFQCPILSSMWMAIRTSNTVLKNIHMVKNATQEEIDDLIAQAYFVRAYAHMELCRGWGGMPYIRYVIGPDDQWDLERLTANETFKNVALDLDSAMIYYNKAGTMRRDPGPGQAGHLNHPDMFRPNGVTAAAMKSRALLYAASPLNNLNGKSDWEEAAIASWEAIQIAEQHEYALLSAADYKKNTVGARYTNEIIWGWYLGATYRIASLTPSIFTNALTHSGQAVSQNGVDMFETKWGDPLNTQEERDAAAAIGHYNEQEPYSNRDPRFYIGVIYNQAPLIGFGQADIYYEMVDGSPVYSWLLNQTYPTFTQTGYHDRKHWGDQSIHNVYNVQYTDPVIRLGELYLNYAESANEAYGPNTPAPGSSMTAVQAGNHIRARIGQADFPSKYTGDENSFRTRIRNERTIELFLEGPYFFDIRRWKIAPEIYNEGVWGVDIEKVPASVAYPTGFKYTRKLIPANRQSKWTSDAMYWIPFMNEDIYKMKNFVPNPSW